MLWHHVASMRHLRQTIQFENDECGVDGSAVRTWCCIFFYLCSYFLPNYILVLCVAHNHSLYPHNPCFLYLLYTFSANLHAVFLCRLRRKHFVQSHMLFCMCGCSQRSVILTVKQYYTYVCRVISLYFHETLE